MSRSENGHGCCSQRDPSVPESRKAKQLSVLYGIRGSGFQIPVARSSSSAESKASSSVQPVLPPNTQMRPSTTTAAEKHRTADIDGSLVHAGAPLHNLQTPAVANLSSPGNSIPPTMTRSFSKEIARWKKVGTLGQEVHTPVTGSSIRQFGYDLTTKGKSPTWSFTSVT